MSKKFILVFDHGTTSIRACLTNKQGEIIARAQQNFEQIYPQAGWVEHNANELWQVSLPIAEAALKNGNKTWADIQAIGITNQRETTILWDRQTGKPVYNAIVWQCRRTTERCKELASQEKTIASKTGLVVDPYFSASKIEWLFKNAPEARELQKQNRLLFGTVDTWILWNLSGRQLHVTDYTNASRTMLYNIHDKCWDADLLKLFDVPENILPTVTSSSAIYGKTDPSLTGGIEIPIAGNAGDQQAALFGQHCWQPGTAKSTYGTGAFLMMNTGEHAVTSKRGLLTTLGVDAAGKPCYALEGAIFIAGAAIEWLHKRLKIFSDVKEIDPLVTKLTDNNGVYFVPAFTGLGAPHWDPNARGVIVGLTQDAGPEHLIRAALEAMAYQTQEVLSAMQDEAHLNIPALRVDGGVSRSGFLVQFMADLLDLPVMRTDDAELTAKGAAYLAGLATGFWASTDELARLPEQLEGFMPSSVLGTQQRKVLLREWQSAVAKAKSDFELTAPKADFVLS